MREIKFRAWDKKRKEIFPVHELGFDKISNLIQTVIGYDDHDSDGWTRHGGHDNRYANGVRFEMMQYTGLKDRNGKEIYEGDIFKEWQGNIRMVTWKDFFWVFELSEKQRKELGHRYEDFHNVGEVIGNIYEHPHLLNQE
ncbi:YopX family protein [Brevibacillus laterosporus]|uniref:YopX family protein n=1 Tax=Brevibacillus laterosporus TaxID=1465 RepID=UPI002E24DBE3|nr:YopX family protein [Brevibacillus laterosporus]